MFRTAGTKCLTDESIIESLFKSHHLGPSFESFDVLALTQHSDEDTESTACQQKFQIQLPECWTQSTQPDCTSMKRIRQGLSILKKTQSVLGQESDAPLQWMCLFPCSGHFSWVARSQGSWRPFSLPAWKVSPCIMIVHVWRPRPKQRLAYHT